MSDRLLLNMMDLRVVLNCSSNDFCLMDLSNSSDPTKPQVKPKVQLSHVELKIRKVKLDEAVSDGIERMLKQTPALYPIRRVECKILTVKNSTKFLLAPDKTTFFQDSFQKRLWLVS